MSTTIMRDSKIGDAWIREVQKLNPISRVIDPKTGQPNGNILTGPVRLAFCDPLFEPRKPQGRENDPTAKGKYSTVALYPPGADFTIMYEEWYKIMGQVFPEYYNAEARQYYGLDNPFHDQAAKHQYAGFTNGCVYMTHTSNYQPQIVDANFNPVTDRSRVHAGAWCILAVNAYPYGKSPPQPRKGVGFGLQQVMLIADDTSLSGGQPDPRSTFAGTNIKPPAVSPAAGFGAPPGMPGAPPPGMPGAPPAQPSFAPPPSYGLSPPPASAADDDISQFV